MHVCCLIIDLNKRSRAPDCSTVSGSCNPLLLHINNASTKLTDQCVPSSTLQGSADHHRQMCYLPLILSVPNTKANKSLQRYTIFVIHLFVYLLIKIKYLQKHIHKSILAHLLIKLYTVLFKCLASKLLLFNWEYFLFYVFSVSHDPWEIILIGWFSAHETFIIIAVVVENSLSASEYCFFGGNSDIFRDSLMTIKFNRINFN